jgi:hypothetical protein
MENFGIPASDSDDEFENDYEPSSAEDEEQKSKKPESKLIDLNFDLLDAKGLKILRKLARFLLERYMHPREFYGPTIKK